MCLCTWLPICLLNNKQNVEGRGEGAAHSSSPTSTMPGDELGEVPAPHHLVTITLHPQQYISLHTLLLAWPHGSPTPETCREQRKLRSVPFTFQIRESSYRQYNAAAPQLTILCTFRGICILLLSHSSATNNFCSTGRLKISAFLFSSS